MRAIHRAENAPRGHVLVTGAGTGIGRACTLRLARRGFVVWAGIRTAAEAAALITASGDASSAIRPINLDITDASQIHAAAVHIRSGTARDGLCGIVNNAGICVVGPVESVALADWRHQFDVNLFGAIAVTNAMLPLLREYAARNARHGSRIVNIGSITGEIATPVFGAYSASKFALRAMTDALRLELRAEGIRVSLIVPGMIQSEIWRKEQEGVDALARNAAARQTYGALIDNVARSVFQRARQALPADRVARVVQRCFTDRTPRMRYRVGWEADIGSFAKALMPDRLFELLLGRSLGVPSRTHPVSQHPRRSAPSRWPTSPNNQLRDKDLQR